MLEQSEQLNPDDPDGSVGGGPDSRGTTPFTEPAGSDDDGDARFAETDDHPDELVDFPDDADTDLDQAEPVDHPERFAWLKTLQAGSTRRALLLTALGGLLIAGLLTALPINRHQTGLGTYLNLDPAPEAGDSTFSKCTFARAGAFGKVS